MGITFRLPVLNNQFLLMTYYYKLFGILFPCVAVIFIQNAEPEWRFFSTASCVYDIFAFDFVRAAMYRVPILKVSRIRLNIIIYVLSPSKWCTCSTIGDNRLYCTYDLLLVNVFGRLAITSFSI